MHVDVFLRVAPIASGRAQPFHRFDGGETLIPEHDLFAGSLPQLFRERAELLLAGVRPRALRNADDERLGIELARQVLQLRDYVSFVAHHRMRRRDDAGVADRDADPPRAQIDSDERHAGIVE